MGQQFGLAFDEIGTSQRRNTEVRLIHRYSEPDSNLGSPQATYPGLHPAHGISVVAARPSHSPSFDQHLRGRAPLTPIARALRCPRRTTTRLPRVTPL